MPPTLVTQLIAGNRDAFAELYDLFGRKLYATAVQLNCTHQEAEDIVHDLFVELAHHRHELSNIKNLEAYIFTMLRNAVSRLRRRKKIGLKAFLRWTSEQVARNRTYDVPATLPDEELSKALNLLPEQQRIVLVLKVISGLSFKQISSVIGIKMNTAASRYRYAIQKLQSALGSKDQ